MHLRRRFVIALALVSPLGCTGDDNSGQAADSGADGSVATPQHDAGSDGSASNGDDAASDSSSASDAPSEACPAAAPPPSGFALVDPGADQGNGTADRGMHLGLALDGDGSPLVAYERVVDVDGGAKASEVWFTRWDRSCGGRWVAPIRVDGADHLTDNTRGIDVAYDASNGMIGIAYRATTNIPSPADTVYELRVATMAKGASAFTVETAFGDHTSDPNAPSGPNSAAIAMANGTIWIAGTAGIINTGCTSNCDGVLWSKKSGATWETPTHLVAPFIEMYGVSLQVDSAGTPAIAYGHGNQAGSASALTYQRLTGNAVDVMTGVATDAPVDLAFDGTKPRLFGKMHQADWATTNKEMWFASSNDGVTWTAPVSAPNDQGDIFDQFPTIAVGPSGTIAVASAINQSNGTRSFGTPKYATATDLKTFTTTGPAVVGNAGIDYTQWIRAAYGEGGKLEIAFYLSIPTSPYLTGQGLVFWRQP